MSRPRGRHKAGGPYFVAGERAVLELLDAAPERVRRIVAARDLPAMEAAAAVAGIAVERVDADRLRALAGEVLAGFGVASGRVDPRGVLAVAEPPPVHALDPLLELALAAPGPRQLLVALDGVEDPQNVGAIARSCEFFGVSGLFWPRDRACRLTPAVARASAGASERIALGEVGNLADALRRCKDAGLWVVGTVVDGGENLFRLCAEDRLPRALVLVLGSESAGLRRLTRERCDFLVTLPRRGRIGSLNVSAAAAATLAILTAEQRSSGAVTRSSGGD